MQNISHTVPFCKNIYMLYKNVNMRRSKSREREKKKIKRVDRNSVYLLRRFIRIHASVSGGRLHFYVYSCNTLIHTHLLCWQNNWYKISSFWLFFLPILIDLFFSTWLSHVGCVCKEWTRKHMLLLLSSRYYYSLLMMHVLLVADFLF